MSLRPAFEIGIWNAWILMVLLLAAGIVPIYIGKERAEKRFEGDPTVSEWNRSTRIAFATTRVIIILSFIYCIFLPLKLGTVWLIAGLPIYVFAVAMVFMFSVTFSTAPLGAPISKGVYAISRHPGYFGAFLGYVGIGIASASWVFLLFAVVWITSWHVVVIEEERILLEKYGDAYRKYMNRTPRWIGFPKAM